MVIPAENHFSTVLKVPVGRDGFLNEIHPKLRPVETVVDGVYICGAAQGPKSSAESVTAALAAVAQSASVLRRGTAELDPLVAVVDPAACVWCGGCEQSCPYGAVLRGSTDEVERAVIDETMCKGCGGCVPDCPKDAIDLRGYTDAQIRSAIESLLEAAS